jgi:hypothetical protein
MSLTSTAALRALLPPPAPDVPGLPTGLSELDGALQGGGLPRGRLTEIVGARGSGKTTLLRRIVEEAVERAGWVAYIDATRTLAPRDWAHLGEYEGVWMIRPTDPARAAWCADVLLRCGAFSLVVIDSAPALGRTIAVRLTRLARESSAALVVVAEENGQQSATLSGAVRLRVKRGRSPRSATPPFSAASRSASRTAPEGEGAVRRLAIVIEKGGVHRTVEVSCAIGVARRLCTHPQVPDRRGVAQRQTGRSGSERRAAPPAVPDAGSLPAQPAVRQLPRKRRCAEPDYSRGSRGEGRGSRNCGHATRDPRSATRSTVGA